jgi:molybdate transport system substrate-binding protein
MNRLFAPLAALLLGSTPLDTRADTALIAAASSLKWALPEAVELFESRHRGRLRISYGSSGNFQRQILEGAPFELFLAADGSYVRALHQADLTKDDGTVYALGRLAFYARHGSALKPDSELRSLASGIASGAIQRFAIANPKHAPYGRAARDALHTADIWQLLRPLLVIGENAAQAARFASTDTVQGGLIPLSLALTPTLSSLGSHEVISATLHTPLHQRMVLMRNAGPTAQAFYTWLTMAEARELLRRHGFAPPPG